MEHNNSMTVQSLRDNGSTTNKYSALSHGQMEASMLANSKGV